jgi:predicted nucleotidyltransferase
MPAIPPDIERAIQAELDSVKREHAVRILWACESGSRAWGFPSPDSDFDVRFIYVHERDWYLSIEPGRDVIERPVDEVFDVSGWDLRKALRLLRGGNATPAEWVDSPIVYRETPEFRDDFVALIERAHRPDRSYWHYRSVSERHQALATARDQVKVKKFLYALRTCLAAEWAATRDEKPPMRLEALVAGIGLDVATVARIDELVAMKAGLSERSDAAVDRDLVVWLSERVAALSGLDVAPVAPAPAEWFDECLLRWLDDDSRSGTSR